MSDKLILGIGCDRGTSVKTLESAINEALDCTQSQWQQISALATIDKKNDEQGLLAIAAKNAWPLHFFSAEQLRQVTVPNPSEVVMKYMGTPAVAEAAAMLAAKTDIQGLILEKLKYRGEDDKNATVSIVKTCEVQ